MKKNITLILSALSLVFIFAVQSFAQQKTISGKLSQTVEAGGWLIVENNEKYLLLNADKFSKQSWFKAGAMVTATGEIKRDAVTIYQEGIPFEANSLRPVDDAKNKRATSVTVMGDARVMVQPDTTIISVSVVTQNRNAVEAQQQNAAQTQTVIGALKRAAGSNAEIKTSGYTLTPQRVYKENQPPTIVGYEARNSITVTMSDLNRVGTVIDAATQAGANNIDSVAFTLRQDRPTRDKALTDATREAIGKAQTIAQALGGRVVNILAVQEGGATVRPIIYADREAYATKTASTPIEIGTLEINSQVQLIAEIEVG